MVLQIYQENTNQTFCQERHTGIYIHMAYKPREKMFKISIILEIQIKPAGGHF